MLTIQFFQQVIKNRLAQIFVLINAIKWIFLFFFKPIGDGVELYHSPFYYKILISLDLPSILSAVLLLNILGFIKLEISIAASIFYLMIMFFSCIQWLLLGYGISKLWKYFTTKNRND